MGVSKSRKICIFILAILLIFSPIVVFDYSNNEKIEKEIKIDKNNKLKPLDQEGKTYRLVTSQDNVQVPVPKGYVASNITGENYVTPEYQYSTITHKGNYTQLNWSSPEGEQYPWTQDENGIWMRGNKGIPNSESVLESEEFDYINGTTLTLKYSYSSARYDYLNIELINLTNNVIQRIAYNMYGNTNSSFNYVTSNISWTMNNGKTGRYKIRAKYSKNESGDEGQDGAFIKESTYYKEDENGTEIVEEDIKTKIHDGGFVIYQLTDEEIETDPNGTSININDTNKDIAQSTRNQYVWVPIPNIEDIVRTKTQNNGIMQFGQEYIFSNTSIKKQAGTNPNFYNEPRLEERHDKTKRYLQRYAKQHKREDYLYNMQEEYNRMIKSINKYKGFYIGRYETGDEISHNLYKKDFSIPKIVRYNSNINYVTWYDSYNNLERLLEETEKYVETGMLYDSLWDYTLKWLNETGTRNYIDINSDSGTWGNYSNNRVKYKESAYGTERVKEATSKKLIPTGGTIEIVYNGEIYSNSPTASNNIFDIAGNVEEWTRSRYSYGGNIHRKNRGSSFDNNSNTFQASRNNNSYPDTVREYFGVRAQLYIL